MNSPAGALEFGVFSHLANRPGVSVGRRLREFIAEAELADDLRFDYLFTTEHHFSGDFSLSPSQPVTLTMLATHTSRLRFGPMVVILPISQPLRVAEEMLILDHLSDGRLEVGFGRGTLPHEHVMYGVAPASDRGRLLEGINVIERLWTADSPLHHMGEYYQYHGVEMPWRPLQHPHPPIWVPSTSRSSAIAWAKRDFGTGAFGLLPIDLNIAAFQAYREGRAEAGLPASGERSNYMVATLVAETDKEARALATEHFGHQMSLFQSEAHVTRRMNGQAHITGSNTDPYPRLASEASAGGAPYNLVWGTPDTVVERIRELREILGLTMFLGEFSFGHLDHEQVTRSLTLFSDEVIPKLIDA